MYNKVIMLGRVTQDLELKTTPQGISVLSFSIAVDRRYQVKGEERKSDFFNCVAWRNEAEFISRFWSKGRPILVEGELQNRSYVDKNGITRYVTEIIVDRATFTGDSRRNDNSGYIQNAGFPEPPPQHSGSSGSSSSFTEQAPSNSNEGFTAKDFETSAMDEEYPF